MRDFIVKYKEAILIVIGTLLIILSLFCILYDRFNLLKTEYFAEIELLKYNENGDNKESNNDDIESIDVKTENVDEKDNNSKNNNSDSNQGKKEYIGFLEINKIGLKGGLVSKDSKYNNVNNNIQIIKTSDYPDIKNGNMILAAHSGSSGISYFKNLYKLKIGDEAKVYYKDYVYHYQITEIFNIEKNGKYSVKHDKDKTILTLITCTKNSNTLQTVYILELYSKTKSGE